MAMKQRREPVDIIKMKIIITGGGGFLGQRVARELLERGQVNDADGRHQPIRELVLVDIAQPPKGLSDVRLPAVSVRPGKPNAAASSFASGILREPLNGVEAICPVEPETELWLISPRLAVKCLLHAFELPREKLGAIRSLSLPGITASVREMVASLERVAGPAAAKRIRWEPDEKIKAIVKSWPARFDTARADSLGFPRDKGGFDRIIADYVHEEGVKL
jgi:nucleoside-diphosphate-sugar epimerase